MNARNKPLFVLTFAMFALMQSGLVLACHANAQVGRASMGSGGTGTVRLSSNGHCPKDRCQVQVEYEITYRHTVDMNGFPVTTFGSERKTGYLNIEGSGAFSERDTADFVLMACAMRARCEIVEAKHKSSSCS